MNIEEKIVDLLNENVEISNIYNKILKVERNNIYKVKRKDIREDIKKIIEEGVSRNENR